MANIDYTLMVNKATAKIESAGQTVTVINANKTILDTTVGIRGNLNNNNTPGTLTEAADAVFVLTAATTNLTLGNYLNVDSVIYKIVSVNPSSPGGTVILYNVYVAT